MLKNGWVGLVCSLLGRFTSHVVDCEAIGILVNLDLSLELKRINLMHRANFDWLLILRMRELLKQR